jgi:hypothetical protein
LECQYGFVFVVAEFLGVKRNFSFVFVVDIVDQRNECISFFFINGFDVLGVLMERSINIFTIIFSEEVIVVEEVGYCDV